ncbi:MAG: hypothetical protein ACOX7Q_04240 [Kiritimatiellia bacterium]
MAEAKLNREYAVRVAGVGALLLGICLWSLYDGRVAWPRQNRVMEQVRPALLATNLTAEAWLSQDDGERGTRLDAAFRARGAAKAPSKLTRKLSELRIPDSTPDRDAARVAQLEQVRKTLEQPIYSARDLQTQFVQAAVTLVLALCAFAAVGIKAPRRFVADDTGLHGSGIGTQPIGYDEIQAADWARWDEKGIVRLTLKDGRRLKLDGWHFAGMTGIVEELLRHRPDLRARQPDAD